jgi:hypothetical protein
MFFAFPEDARWNADRQVVEFGVEIGEYRGVVRVPRRVFQRLLPEQPTPERCVKQSRLDAIVPDLATSWAWHLGPNPRQGPRNTPQQRTQVMVQEPRSGHDNRRRRDHLSAEAAAARLFDADRPRLVADRI